MITLVLQEASGAFATTSGRILEVANLGDSPSVLTTFLYTDLTFFTSGGLTLATYDVDPTGSYVAYQWGNTAGWSLESPWISVNGQLNNSCLVYGIVLNMDGSPADGVSISGIYSGQGNFIDPVVLASKQNVTTVSPDGTFSLILLRGAKVKFALSSHNPNPTKEIKTYSQGTVPNLETADISSFAKNV